MSEPHFQICRFCQRNVKLAYYCESCGTSCCSDCLHEEKIKSFEPQEVDSFEQLKDKDIDFISAHGTATPYNDDMESIALDRNNLNNLTGGIK